MESLRGLGALTVAGYHMTGWSFNGATLLAPRAAIDFGDMWTIVNRIGYALIPGHAALMMFFAISGLVLHTSLQYAPRNIATASLRFVIARVFRIYPIVTVSVVLTAIAYGWKTMEGVPEPVTWDSFILNLLLIDTSINSTLWAIKVEAMMVPCILLLFFAERAFGTRVLVAVVIVMAAASFAKQNYIYPPFVHFFYAFAVGMLIPSLGRQMVERLSLQSANRLLAISVAFLVLTGQILPFFSQFTALIETISAFVLLSLVTYCPDLRGVGFLDRAFWRKLGMASGSYYVLHMALLPYIVAGLSLIFPLWPSIHVPQLVCFVVFPLAMLLMFPFALLGFHLIEAPFMAAGRKVLRWLNLDRAKLPSQPQAAAAPN
ncbi:MAG: hypothetical protein A4S14_18555 [Proteobacteria bacterium SG_bin9]|nr:MAG: hypothetical protein A4S14_18555 [Proteobacteria bacterium SG_bin9]